MPVPRTCNIAANSQRCGEKRSHCPGSETHAHLSHFRRRDRFANDSGVFFRSSSFTSLIPFRLIYSGWIFKRFVNKFAGLFLGRSSILFAFLFGVWHVNVVLIFRSSWGVISYLQMILFPNYRPKWQWRIDEFSGNVFFNSSSNFAALYFSFDRNWCPKL